MSFWGQKTFCVVAGASRGIGQAIAISFAQHVAPGSVFVLLARTTSTLDETKSKILANPENKCSSIIATSIDLSRPDQPAFKSAITNAFHESSTKPSDFQHSILVQCAASLGIDQGYRVHQIQDVDYIRNYYDFNLTSFILLNSVFCEVTEVINTDSNRMTSIVHISSHGAVEPFKTWGLYCAARAAKDMLLKSIALEAPNIQTLNYAPGLVDTENYREALRDTADQELLKLLAEEKEKGVLLAPSQTAEKLVEILASGKYTKGEHVSYSDY